MCGIVGIYRFDSGGVEISPELIASTLETMYHRGPDDQGIYVDPERRIGLGHRRLSIIDLAGGHQPMTNEDRTVWLIFNGEIYNFVDLRRSIAHRHLFRTASDTEVLVHLYEEHGLDMFQQLNGMFAIAIWDAREQKLILARDRMGIKPLYFTRADGMLTFASELNGLVKPPYASWELDPGAIDLFLHLRYVPSPMTMLKDVFKLKPGHWLTCDRSGRVSTGSYWDTAAACQDQRPLYEEDYLARIEWVLKDAVRMQMVSDVPYGAFLSGGVDSSLMVALMSQFSTKPIQTYSIGFTEAGYNEFDHSRRVASLYHTDHHEFFLDRTDFLRFLPDSILYMDDPSADLAAVPIYFIANLARNNGLKVMLSGEGSDELFGGYSFYLPFLSAGRFLSPLRAAPLGLREWLYRLLRRLRPDGEDLYYIRRVLLDQFPYGHITMPFSSLELQDGTTSMPFYSAEFRSYLAGHAAADGSQDELGGYYQTARKYDLDLLNTLLFVDLHSRIPDDLLVRLDRMTMATSIEGRVPFLDHRLVELAMAMPSRLKISRDGTQKYILKRVASRFLPREIVYRKKEGFPVPVARWMREQPVQSLFREIIYAHRHPELFDYDAIHRLLEEQRRGERDHSMLVWRLCCFKLWHMKFAGEARAAV